ncbi:DUF2934 domain-containing protein, partial [Candidatus Dependentiae bacterium]|nr:DUF2934 domain-containing protein [Candidatus Dependentiae bacterium]
MTKSMNELIAERAYYYFLKRGGVHGYHHQDWSRAEAEIKAELEKSSISQVAAKQEAEVEKKVEQEKTVQKST